MSKPLWLNASAHRASSHAGSSPPRSHTSTGGHSAGIGTQTHLAAENFSYAAGIDMTHVPYKGESAAITDLMDVQTYAATVARLADAVPRQGAQQIAQILLDQLQLAPPTRKRRLRLPHMVDLRRLSAHRLRLSAARARRRKGFAMRRWRLKPIRGLPRWRRSRHS